MDRKIIVLDDDPTGIQTVHDVVVITVVDYELIKEAFSRKEKMFYILTNSRSFDEAKTIAYHRKLMSIIEEASLATKCDYMIVSRSDSTLRGHYPLETEIIQSCLQKKGKKMDGEILCPYLEGIRKTEDDIHYVISDGHSIPCGESEFSKDKTFGYKSSDLKEYVEEKTKGRFKAKDCISITIDDLKAYDKTRILDKLNSAHDFQKIIVNANCIEDLITFVHVFEKVKDKSFLFRCAASLVKCLGHITSIPFLTKSECVDLHNGKGGLILVGSHVHKTATQLQYLKEHEDDIVWITFDQHKILDNTLHEESLRVGKRIDEMLAQEKVVVVATRRDRVDFPQDNPQKQLEWATLISQELIHVLTSLKQRPSFLITKGGITSSDALTLGLQVKKEWVLGQIAPLVGVVKCLEESRFPGLPVVVFPGNVGSDDTLYHIVQQLR